jgi:hypothetical protein
MHSGKVFRMRTIGLLTVGLILAAVVTQTMATGGDSSKSPIAAAATSQPAAARTLTGTFVWNNSGNKSYPLKVVLTPSGTNTFTAVYSFSWGGKPTAFTGVVTVNPDTREVKGTAKTADGGRTFAFSGKEANGVITFTHRETTGGGNAQTGTGMLK